MATKHHALMGLIASAALAAQPDVKTLNEQGKALELQGRYDEAETHFRQALALCDHVDSSGCELFPALLNNLALIYRHKNQPADAEGLYRRALDEMGSAPRPFHAETMNNLGVLLADQGRWKEAEVLERKSIAEWEGLMGSDHPTIAAGLINLSVALRAQRRPQEASRMLDRARSINERHFPPNHPRIAAELNAAGALAADRKRYPEAEALLLKALAINERVLPPGHPDLGLTLNNLAEVYRSQKKLDQAEQTYRRALEILERAWGPADPRLLKWLDTYALVLRTRQDYVEANRRDMQATRIRVVHSLRSGN